MIVVILIALQLATVYSLPRKGRKYTKRLHNLVFNESSLDYKNGNTLVVKFVIVALRARLLIHDTRINQSHQRTN